MREENRPVTAITVADLLAHPVWQYVHVENSDETAVRPIKRVPVANLTNKIVGDQVTLSNGERIWALIGNVDTTNARFTSHFLTLSVEREARWFSLARYHDYDFFERGPEALARFLGRSTSEVFPITYDIRKYAKGDPAALNSQILLEPIERLSRAEIIAMAVP